MAICFYFPLLSPETVRFGANLKSVGPVDLVKCRQRSPGGRSGQKSINHVIMQSMAELATTLPAPLTAWEDGTIRVGSSRVLFDLVVHHFKQGATAEQIQHSFPSLTLRDVYGSLFYYLEHTEEVEAYLAKQELQADEIERAVRNVQGPSFLQRRLEERRARTLK